MLLWLNQKEVMRLNLFIAKSGYVSRRGADRLIKEGKIEVNGQKVLEPFRMVSSCDKITVNRKLLSLKKHLYILFNKPKGVTTTLSDKFADKKVIDFFPSNFRGIYPVGRLDKQSSGLLILTNDGDLCYRLTHPKFAIEKEYLVEFNKALTSRDCQKAKKGCWVEGEYLSLRSIKRLKRGRDQTFCTVVVSEGKKRHLRRLFKSLGSPIRELKRVRVGGLVLGKLAPGEYKLIAREKIYSFFKF